MTKIWVSCFCWPQSSNSPYVGPASISAALPAWQARAQVISDVQIVSRGTLGWLFRSASQQLCPTPKNLSLPICTFFFCTKCHFAWRLTHSWVGDGMKTSAGTLRSPPSVSGCNRCNKNNSVGVCYGLNANERMGTCWRCDSGGDIECWPQCLLAFWKAGAWLQK